MMFFRARLNETIILLCPNAVCCVLHCVLPVIAGGQGTVSDALNVRRVKGILCQAIACFPELRSNRVGWRWRCGNVQLRQRWMVQLDTPRRPRHEWLHHHAPSILWGRVIF
ncbi:hypothetical protein X949_5208 [Burkholderia pseudomallei MSHR5609]|nr:hypothetical protein X949_5208 [Burkholderia pseudomallei MSHR5609]